MLTQQTFDTCIFQFPFWLTTEILSRLMAHSMHGYLVMLKYFCPLSVESPEYTSDLGMDYSYSREIMRNDYINLAILSNHATH